MINYYLLSITTSGMKNIAKPITIDFSKKTGISSIQPTGNNVTGIYGSNGAGKSAVIMSVLFAKGMTTKPDYLASDRAKNIIFTFLNKETNRFDFSITFADYDSENDNKVGNIYRYSLSLAFEGVSAKIQSESLSLIRGRRLTGVESPVFSITNGVLSFFSKDPHGFQSFIVEKTLNVLTNSTLLSQFGRLLESILAARPELEEQKIPEFMYAWFSANAFMSSIAIHLEHQDEDVVYRPNEKEIAKLQDMEPERIKDNVLSNIKNVGKGIHRIPKEEYASYQKHVAKLTEFLRLFKPDLQKIEIERREDERYYYCSKVLVYPAYSISASCESTGIRKVLQMFPLLDAASNGNVVFIDELDANISGPYLEKLVLYMLHYGKGQLIFTAHSMDPMKVLVKTKSLYFIGENNVVTYWANSGNYKPYILYPEGMIEGLPFNIDDFDFLSCFSSEDNEESGGQDE